jgi:hypothetical protein
VAWMRRAAGVAAAGLVLVSCAAADGSDVATLGGSEESTPQPDAPVDREEAFLRFAECMRDHGVDVGDPQGSEDGGEVIAIGDEGVDPQEVQEADAACRHLLPEGTDDPPDLTPQERARIRDQMVRFADCMRGQGIDFPDPEPQGDGGIFFGPGGDLNPDDPEVRAAEEACRRFLPGDVTREEP